MLTQGMVFANGKGGVGKTSIAANVAGLAAASGWTTLVVDLDPQGNMGDDLGYRGTDEDDRGAGLAAAVVSGTAPTSFEARPNLWAIAGGASTSELASVLTTRLNNQPETEPLREVGQAIQRHVAASSRTYNLIVFDTPPAASSVLVDAAFAASRWLVIPTKADNGSIRGLELTAAAYQRVRSAHNADLAVAGISMFGIGVQEKSVRQKARSSLESIVGEHGIKVFDTTIRHSGKSAQDLRELGKLAHEYEIDAANAPKFWERLRSGSSGGQSYSSAATGLAGDYQDLTNEVLEVLTC